MAKSDDKPFEVEATGKGVYASKRRKPGDRFTVAKADHFNPNWMRRAETPKASRSSAPRTTPSGGSSQEASGDTEGLA